MNREEKAEHLIALIKQEQKAQQEKWNFSENVSLRSLKAQGLVLHPLKIKRRKYGFADYPIVEFELPFETDTSNFKSGVALEFFAHHEEQQSCNAQLVFLNNRSGEIRLFAPDFPEWIEERNLGIKLVPDDKSFKFMLHALKAIKNGEDKHTAHLFEIVHGLKASKNEHITSTESSDTLNNSQAIAAKAVTKNEDVCILHGPPGTGKTTTLVAAVKELLKKGEKIAVTAPSNAAVDHFTRCLIAQNIDVLRMGNSAKVDEELFHHTTEGVAQNAEEQKRIKRLKIQANELRKMAQQYKRNFGKSEREQRKLLYQEVKSIRQEIKQLENFSLEKAVQKAQVITGTPVGLQDELLKEQRFDTLLIDEAGQCLEPMAWVAIEKADKLVLAGDPFQLPPTVISDAASRDGLSLSILEQTFQHQIPTYLLNTQYRMQEKIAGFSSQHFYKGELLTDEPLKQGGENALHFYDTAGYEAPEKQGEDGYSLSNLEEIRIIEKLIGDLKLKRKDIAFISPYAAQVSLAKKLLDGIKCSTIDAFQGQEKPIIFISLVRSNSEGNIGFLKDYRRMNVALTRAQKQLFVIGDSATFGNDAFYSEYLTYVENKEAYKSVFEVMY